MPARLRYGFEAVIDEDLGEETEIEFSFTIPISRIKDDPSMVDSVQQYFTAASALSNAKDELIYLVIDSTELKRQNALIFLKKEFTDFL